MNKLAFVFYTGNGICVDYEECQCDDHWIGFSCEIPTCNDKNNCSSNGECVSPNKCECFEQYEGENCTEQVTDNLNSPMFVNVSYSAVVSENRGKGFVVLTVSANDSDHGRSGEISYAINQENIEKFFTIGQDSGEIKVAADGVLDYEKISPKQYTFLVSATDNGFPPRSSEATVTITVEDENDNCPVFETVSGQYKIPVEILASDDDTGNNGQIQYSITEQSDPDGNFFITSNGTLFANGILQPGAYLLTIIARDGGIIPCARELSLTIIVDEIVLSNGVVPTSSLLSTGTSFVLPTYSSMFLKSSLSIQTKVTAVRQTSSIESSTITLRPSSTSSLTLSNTTMSSPFKSSTIVLPVLPTLQSNITLPQSSSFLKSSLSANDAPSSLQSRTLFYEPSITLESTSISLQIPSSFVSFSSHQSGTRNTWSSNTPQVQPTKTSSTGSPMSSTPSSTFYSVLVEIRMLNVNFVDLHQDKSSAFYRTLRNMMDPILITVFEKIVGFVRISDVDFKKGSVIANVQTEFSSENGQVSTVTLARAIIDASDENGNLGQIKSDISFLQQQVTSRTSTTPPYDEDGDKDNNALIGAVSAVVSGALICVLLATFFVSFNFYKLLLLYNIVTI